MFRELNVSVSTLLIIVSLLLIIVILLSLSRLLSSLNCQEKITFLLNQNILKCQLSILMKFKSSFPQNLLITKFRFRKIKLSRGTSLAGKPKTKLCVQFFSWFFLTTEIFYFLLKNVLVALVSQRQSCEKQWLVSNSSRKF